MRRANHRGLKDVVFQHPRSEKSFDQIQDVSVGHFGRDCRHDDAMREIVKESLDVRVEYHLVPFAVECQDSLDRLMAVTPRDEAVRMIVKLWFKDRCEKSADDFLSSPITDHWYAERSSLLRTGAFLDVDTTQWQGPERSCF